jgi:hypothetical protein
VNQQPTIDDDMMLGDHMNMHTAPVDMFVNHYMDQGLIDIDMLVNPSTVEKDWVIPENTRDMHPNHELSPSERMNQSRTHSHDDEGCSAFHFTQNRSHYMIVFLLFTIYLRRIS